MKKKIVSLLLCISMLCSITVPTFATEPEGDHIHVETVFCTECNGVDAHAEGCVNATPAVESCAACGQTECVCCKECKQPPEKGHLDTCSKYQAVAQLNLDDVETPPETCTTCGQTECICCEDCNAYPCECEDDVVLCTECGKPEAECICCEECGKAECICCEDCGTYPCECKTDVVLCTTCGKPEAECICCPDCGEADGHLTTCPQYEAPVVTFCPDCGKLPCECVVCETCGKVEAECECCEYCGKLPCECVVCETCGKVEAECECCEYCGKLLCECVVCENCGKVEAECKCIPCEFCSQKKCICERCEVCGNVQCVCLYRELIAAQTIEELFALIEAAAETNLDALFALTELQIKVLAGKAEDLPYADPENPDEYWRTEVLAILAMMPNSTLQPCADCGWVKGHASTCPWVLAQTLELSTTLKPGYICFDLYYGDVSITDSTYSGYIGTGVAGKSEKVSAAHQDSNKYYIFQSNGEGYTSIPEYDRVRYAGKSWGEYITNNTDVVGVIDAWEKAALEVGRKATGKNATVTNTEGNTVNSHHRIQIENKTDTKSPRFNVTIDNVWSGFENDNAYDTNGDFFTSSGYNMHTKRLAGFNFLPNNTTATLDLYLKGDNRFGGIYYHAGKAYAGYDTKDSNATIDGRIEQFVFHNGESGGMAGTLTVANLSGDTGMNHFCAVIGGANSPNYAPGLVFEGGIIYAGATAKDNCTAIGGGGCGFGGVTINGGTITAVTSTNGSAIGGGIGDGSNGGAANVKITGGTVYAYNNGLAIRSTRESNGKEGTDAEKIFAAMPAVAIGSGSSRRSWTVPAKIEITGGTVYAQSVGGTAIGGGSSNNFDAADAKIDISGGIVTAKSVAGKVPVIVEYDGGKIPDYLNSSNNVVDDYSGANKYSVPASNSIGGGTAGIPFRYDTENAANAGKLYAQGNGGNCILSISNTAKVYAGSIGGGGVIDVNTSTDTAPRPDNNAKIGSAQVTISGGTIQGQVIMAKGAEMDCSFTMTGGIINNITKTSDFVFLKENGGAVYIENGTATMSGGTIKNCTAELGGAIYVSNGAFNMSGGTLQNNSAENGGAVYVTGGSVTMSNGTMTGNTAPEKGGAVYVTGGNFTMTSGEMTYNGTNATTETQYGGAVYANGGTITIGIDGCTRAVSKHTSPLTHPVLKENVAEFGGALSVHGGKVYIYCCDMTDNESNNKGTGNNIYLDGGSIIEDLRGATIGETEDPGIVNVGGDVTINHETGTFYITINYHSNTSTNIVWSGRAPENYYINLPYCPDDWVNDAPAGTTFVGWTKEALQGDLSYVRDKDAYLQVGDPIKIEDTDGTADHNIHYYAVWAPATSSISYRYHVADTVSGNNLTYRSDLGNAIMATSQTVPGGTSRYTAGSKAPETYDYKRLTEYGIVSAPEMAGYVWHGWKLYADMTKMSNWGSDAAVSKEAWASTTINMDHLSALRLIQQVNNTQNFGDITLVSVFTENQATIKYEIVGPTTTCATLSSADQTGVYVDTGVVAPVTVTAASGFKIEGWYTDAACTQKVADSQVVNNGSGYTTDSTLTPAKGDGGNATGLWTTRTYYVKVKYAVADLKIVATGLTPDQSYIFTIEAENGKSFDGNAFTPMQVAIVAMSDGTGKVTIKEVPVGNYIVTEQDGWSWRYTVTGAITATGDAAWNHIDQQTKQGIPKTDEGIHVAVDANVAGDPPTHVVTYNRDDYEDGGKLWLSGLHNRSYQVEDSNVNAPATTFLANLFSFKKKTR